MKQKNGKGNENPIRTPAFIMYIKGRLDAKKGEEVAKSRLDSLLRKLEARETSFVVFEENLSKSDRDRASLLVQEFENTAEHKKAIPSGETESSAVRAYRRGKADNSKLNSIKSELAGISEKLTTNDALLCQDIEYLRSVSYYKIHCYLRGLKAGGVSVELEEQDSTPYEIHKEKHMLLISMISKIINWEGAVLNEEF